MKGKKVVYVDKAGRIMETKRHVGKFKENESTGELLPFSVIEMYFYLIEMLWKSQTTTPRPSYYKISIRRCSNKKFSLRGK